MKEYEDLIEALVGMATVTRPKIAVDDPPAVQRNKNIQHGICDMLEDAAVAIDDLLKLTKVKNEERSYAEAG